jgi:hypothetical protein
MGWWLKLLPALLALGLAVALVLTARAPPLYS